MIKGHRHSWGHFQQPGLVDSPLSRSVFKSPHQWHTSFFEGEKKHLLLETTEKNLIVLVLESMHDHELILTHLHLRLLHYNMINLATSFSNTRSIIMYVIKNHYGLMDWIWKSPIISCQKYYKTFPTVISIAILIFIICWFSLGFKKSSFLHLIPQFRDFFSFISIYFFL